MKFNIAEINQLIHSRRSIFPKDYSGERVNDEVVKQMLENANWAPTHKLTEPWRFKILTGEALEREMRLAGLRAERSYIFRELRARQLGSAAARKLIRELDLLEARYLS